MQDVSDGPAHQRGSSASGCPAGDPKQRRVDEILTANLVIRRVDMATATTDGGQMAEVLIPRSTSTCRGRTLTKRWSASRTTT